MKVYKLKVGDLVVHKGHERDKGIGLIVEADSEMQIDFSHYAFRVMFKGNILWYTKSELRKVRT